MAFAFSKSLPPYHYPLHLAATQKKGPTSTATVFWVGNASKCHSFHAFYLSFLFSFTLHPTLVWQAPECYLGSVLLQ